MDYSIRSFGGCKSADISSGQIVLLIGDGGACKSSIIQAIGSVATGSVIPVHGVTKAEAGKLVHIGAEKASAKMAGKGFEASVTWPKATYEARGNVPFVSTYAAGIDDILDLRPKDRAAVLIPLLQADPTIEDVIRELRLANIHQPSQADPDQGMADSMTGLDLDPGSADDRGLYKLARRLWDKISDVGWDKVASDAAKTGTETKGRWKQATGGKTYGVKVAEDWVPEGWQEDLAGASLDALQAAVAEADAALKKAIATNAIADANVADLKAQVERIPALEAELRNVVTEHGAAWAEWQDISKSDIPSVPSSGIPCPHCKGMLTVTVAGRTPTIAAGGVPRQEIEAAEKARKDFIDRKESISLKHDRLSRRKTELELETGTAKAAKRKLAEIAALQNTGPSVEQATAAATEAGKRLTMFTAWTEARRLHRAIVANQVVIELLSETSESSIRRRKLVNALDQFNRGVLSPLCAGAGWKPVTLNESLEFEYGGRAFQLCKSEEHRIRFIVRVAIALMDKSAMVLIDDFETIPVSSRAGFIKTLLRTGLHAVVAMMVPSPDKAPDLGKMGAGQTIWVENGTIEPYSSAVARYAEKDGKKAA